MIDFLSNKMFPPFYIGLDGKPVEKTPITHPYSYDAFCEYKTDDYQKTTDACFSDRMRQWDYDKFKKCVASVWPSNPDRQSFHGVLPEDVEKFLNLYFERETKLTAITQEYHKGHGYPIWCFYFYHT